MIFNGTLLSCMSMKLRIALSNKDLSQAVDLEVIKEWLNIPSETTSSCNNFRSDLLRAHSVKYTELAHENEVDNPLM